MYRGTEQQLDPGDLLIEGANVVGRWQHRTERSKLQLQAYYDQTERSAPLGGAAFVLHTYDVELQQTTAVGPCNRWCGVRVSESTVTASRIRLPCCLSLRRATYPCEPVCPGHDRPDSCCEIDPGVKFEDDPYSGWSVLPDARLSWQLSDSALLWAASSRAIRSPTPFDVDVVEKVGDLVFLTGKSQFRPERVSAYEIGYRGQPAGEFSVSLSGFYNVYDDLRTVETASSTVFLPLRWDNFMTGRTYGIEAWADWQITPSWRISPAVRTLHKDLSFKTGSSGLLGLAQAGDDPSSQASIKSSLELGHRVSFDAILRYVATLPDPALKAYTELTARLAWQVSPTLELSVSGFNLLHARHYEYPAPAGEQIIRSGLAQARWTF